MGIIGYAPPAESLVWIIERELYWCEQLGLNMVAKVDAVDPTPNAATVATQSILAKAPDVQFILGYNDISTLGAVAAVKAAGKTGVLCATPNGGQDITAMGIKDGTVLCTYNLAWVENGTQAAYAGYDILTEAEPAAADPDRADRHAGHEGQRRPARVPALSPVHSCVARLGAVPRDAPRASCRR